MAHLEAAAVERHWNHSAQQTATADSFHQQHAASADRFYEQQAASASRFQDQQAASVRDFQMEQIHHNDQRALDCQVWDPACFIAAACSCTAALEWPHMLERLWHNEWKQNN